VPILLKIDQVMRPCRESARRRTDTQTHRQTDANRFYNLSHAICYSYGTDNNFYSGMRRARRRVVYFVALLLMSCSVNFEVHAVISSTCCSDCVAIQ